MLVEDSTFLEINIWTILFCWTMSALITADGNSFPRSFNIAKLIPENYLLQWEKYLLGCCSHAFSSNRNHDLLLNFPAQIFVQFACKLKLFATFLLLQHLLVYIASKICFHLLCCSAEVKQRQQIFISEATASVWNIQFNFSHNLNLCLNCK